MESLSRAIQFACQFLRQSEENKDCQVIQVCEKCGKKDRPKKIGLKKDKSKIVCSKEENPKNNSPKNENSEKSKGSAGKCLRGGPITRNGFFNFLREFRMNKCGLSAKEYVRQGAKMWNKFLPEQKKCYKDLGRHIKASRNKYRERCKHSKGKRTRKLKKKSKCKKAKRPKNVNTCSPSKTSQDEVKITWPSKCLTPKTEIDENKKNCATPKPNPARPKKKCQPRKPKAARKKCLPAKPKKLVRKRGCGSPKRKPARKNKCGAQKRKKVAVKKKCPPMKQKKVVGKKC